jgi:triphosphoribosyl-dephospho-CoA synthase
VRACLLDVAVRKPGNVSVVSPGHGMQAKQFVDSARAAALPLFRPRAAVGQRIEEAVAASWVAAGCNTNLGIVLLCAPLAVAAERLGAAHAQAGWIDATERVLAELDVGDAEAAFRGIAQASPGGLGRAASEDVRHRPSRSLRDAMALAADRDLIARVYRDGFGGLFAVGVSALGPTFGPVQSACVATSDPSACAAASTDAVRAVQRCYLSLLADAADTHIVRKHGEELAHSVMEAGRRWRDDPRWSEASWRPELEPEFIEWDEALKRQRLNPGTTADFTVTAMLLAMWSSPQGTDSNNV